MTTADGVVADDRMSLIDHLTELRTRLFKAALAIAICSIVGFWFSETVLGWLNEYYRDAAADQTKTLIIPSPLEGFAIKLKLAGYFGLFASSPVWLWQAWQFITPGLKQKERRYAVPFLVSSVLLFLFGGAVGLLTLPAGLKFLVSVSGKNQELLYQSDKFVSFVTLIVIAFGFSFLFPVVIVFLELVNLVTPKQLMKGWRHAIVAIVIIAAVITPSQDPVSLLGMAIPMVVFYFGAILIGRLAKK
jgi:sec-independent protein translocase protein TatC